MGWARAGGVEGHRKGRVGPPRWGGGGENRNRWTVTYASSEGRCHRHCPRNTPAFEIPGSVVAHEVL